MSDPTHATSWQGRLRAVWRAIPVDVLALVVIALGIYLTHYWYALRGMVFNDPSWYFHFGNRLLDGDVPYRDYVFQVGPLPIFVDAGFQSIFGEKYAASMLAGMFIHVLRTFVVWMLVRRLANAWAAALICVYCVYDPLFGFAHHWSLAYSQLFITLSALFLLLATRARGRAELVYLALAGASAALVVTARQSSAVMIGVVLLGVSTILLVRKHYFTKQRFLALWGGYAAALVVVLGALAALGAAGPAIQQMFLDAPQKKGVSGVVAILDALTGGAIILYQHDPSYSWWSGFLTFLGLPIAFAAAAIFLSSRETTVSTATLGVLVVPLALVLGLLTRYISLSYFTDLPRTFFTAVGALVVLSPDRAVRWFGIPAPVIVGIAVLSLATDWALEMSFSGRGWGDAQSLTLGAILFALASSRVPARAKTALCGALACAGLIYFAVARRLDVNPFAKEEAREGQIEENRYGTRSPKLRGMRLTQGRRDALAYLMAQVPRGSSCFVYGNLPVLYTLLGCENPTRIDSTTADFITAQDAEDALAILRANPPEYLVAHENTWMNPPLTLDLQRDPAKYGGLNPAASLALHVGLRDLLERYEEIGHVADAIGPERAAQLKGRWDAIHMTRIYRHKR